TTETKQAFLQAWNTTKTERTRSGPVEDSRFDTRIDSVTSRIEDVELSERSETGVYWGAPPSLAQ
ncbi:MAG: hypothetical protein H6730_17785, partial [Deltaproteobacteria bacterium]|nr:hypothetical protein [Deltaproteobacteria bacterium]